MLLFLSFIAVLMASFPPDKPLTHTSIAGGVTHVPHGHHSHHRQITNNTLLGLTSGCKHKFDYFITPHVHFPMCMGQSDQDLKNGMSIINLIYSRGYLPTCRVLHLLVYMAAQAGEKHSVSNDFFVDVGANIGKLSKTANITVCMWSFDVNNQDYSQ
ncbi:hypothetical protein EON65_33200 [archaeon]|nr:MAG: hypothetical protein EON65_33200 [archaeon]